ncbi:MAG: hypothetical protein ACF8NJ_05445 [Phycisphaerales bacterium JB038]
MSRKTDVNSGNPGRVGLPLLLGGLLLLAGCETRVISAKGIGSERYDTQPTFEQQYSPWLYEAREKEEEKQPGDAR